MRPVRRPLAAAVLAAAPLTLGVSGRAGGWAAARPRGGVRKTAPARKTPVLQQVERRGKPAAGRIVTLFIGQGHGFIRLANDREVFFHRSDVREGTSFNAFAVGDAVTFELFEDDVSGPRGLRV